MNNLDTFLEKDDIWVLSITATGRCNCNCSYCHFYASRDRKRYMFDITDDLFDSYVDLIKYIQDKYHKKLQVRFSGGEPLVIGDRLFELSKRLYNKTGIEPYVLTNGKALDSKVIEKSANSHIKSYLVSIENPFDQSLGAPKTKEVLEKIKSLNSDEVSVLPAIMIIKNDSFKHLYRIADYVFSEINMLPSFAELTYQAYQSPTEKELQDLYENVRNIASEFYGKTPIRIFPYVSPELYANGQRNFLSELDIENSIGISKENIEEIASKMFSKLNKSYQLNPCKNEECDWYNDCKIIKWLWFYPTDTLSREEKLNDFCRFKKVINNALYDGITQKIGDIDDTTIVASEQ